MHWWLRLRYRVNARFQYIKSRDISHSQFYHPREQRIESRRFAHNVSGLDCCFNLFENMYEACVATSRTFGIK